MYTLYYYPANANAAPHMLLQELGAEYQLALVDRKVNEQKSKEYRNVNPNERIPALRDGELVLFESAAIVLHLVDRHPEPRLAPRPGTAERAKFYQWLVFLTNSLQEELMIYQYPDRLTGDDTKAMGTVMRGAEQRAGRFLDVIEDHLQDNGPFFLGAEVSAVDLYLVMLARWARPMSKPPRARPHIAQLLDLVASRPAVRRAYEAEGISPPIC
jgi:glutathione S-transferase